MPSFITTALISTVLACFSRAAETTCQILTDPSATTSGAVSGSSGADTFAVTGAPYDTVISGSPDSATMSFSGTYTVVDPNGAATGNSYHDNVLTPVALANGASSYVVLLGTGTSGTATNVSFGNMPIQFTSDGVSSYQAFIRDDSVGDGNDRGRLNALSLRMVPAPATLVDFTYNPADGTAEVSHSPATLGGDMNQRSRGREPDRWLFVHRDSHDAGQVVSESVRAVGRSGLG